MVAKTIAGVMEDSEVESLPPLYMAEDYVVEDVDSEDMYKEDKSIDGDELRR